MVVRKPPLERFLRAAFRRDSAGDAIAGIVLKEIVLKEIVLKEIVLKQIVLKQIVAGWGRTEAACHAECLTARKFPAKQQEWPKKSKK